MPRSPRSPEEVDEFRERILEAALEIITEHGFDYFSMRKLALKLNITATTIYNYFSSRDEIYLLILTRGFDILRQILIEAYESCTDIEDKVRAWFKAYINFGIEYANYYNLMYTWDVPKCNDYIGLAEEQVATLEMEAAFKSLAVGEKLYEELALIYPELKQENARFNLTKVWAAAHGVISLYNSKALNYLLEPTPEIIDRLIDHLVKFLFINDNDRVYKN